MQQEVTVSGEAVVEEMQHMVADLSRRLAIASATIRQQDAQLKLLHEEANELRRQAQQPSAG